MLQGRYYVSMEIHLFETASGAKAAYDSFQDRYGKISGSERATTKGLANQSSGWQMLSGTVATSDLVGAFHRFVFRRGNMLAAVQTYGAQPFMTIDRARDIAVIIDERALGTRPATEPTPSGTTVPIIPQ